MAIRNVKLVAALSYLKELQEQGRKVFRGTELARYRGILQKNDYVQELLKGWYIVSSPVDQAGDSTLWNGAWQEFVSTYCNHRFGEEWHLSPEQSLFLHSRNTVAPRQIIVYAGTGQNNTTALMNGASLFDYRAPGIKKKFLMSLDGVKVLIPEAAMIQATENFYRNYPLDAQIVLNTVVDFSVVLGLLQSGGKAAAAGRIAGAYRAVGKKRQADIIIEEMAKSGYAINEVNPFEASATPFNASFIETAFDQRLRLMWSSMRTDIIAGFPSMPGIPANPTNYLKNIEDLYVCDAYHSLSIEGYRVTEGLIRRIQEGAWNPETNPEDIGVAGGRGFCIHGKRCKIGDNGNDGENIFQIIDTCKIRVV